MKKWLLKFKYLINDRYNKRWIQRHDLRFDQTVYIDDFQNNSPYKKYAQPFMTVWLKNIDRILSVFNRHISSEEFNFIDVGCGVGISTIYGGTRCRWQSVSGFDFEKKLIDCAVKNDGFYVGSSVVEKPQIYFFTDDASLYKLPEDKYFLFLFNPFGSEVIRLFVENNIDTLRKYGCVMGYANHRELDAIARFQPKKIESISGYNCSVIFW